MTKEEYKNLWETHFASKAKGIIMPDYCEYLEREHMFEDYLDIFRGSDTRTTRLIQPCNGWYYPHPFFNPDGTPKIQDKISIKYILIGEAAPDNKSATYFYNILHTKTTPYFNQPCKSFGINAADKTDKLLELASKGVILMDLFPFAISFNSFKGLRKLLNKSGVTLSFWNNSLNPYNLQERIFKLSYFLCDDWDLTMIAPCIISEHIVNKLNGFKEITIIPKGSHPTTFRKPSSDTKRCKLGKNWLKIAVTSAGSPSADLIGKSF